MIVFAQLCVASTWLAPRLCPISCVGIMYFPGAQPTYPLIPYEYDGERQIVPTHASPADAAAVLPVNKCAASRGLREIGKFVFQ